MNPYETKRYLGEYLLFHYGQPKDLSPFDILPSDFLRFHERIREECLLPIPKSRGVKESSPIRALDVGCAVGRFSFELKRVADQVVGIDNAKSLIAGARTIARARLATIQIHETGKQFKRIRVQVPRDVPSRGVRFEVGDAQRLESFAQEPFDIVAAINLLCRLPKPSVFLRQLPRLVKPGGQLVIASPFSWLPEYTPKREWIDQDKLKRLLAPSFRLARARDLPFLIREHRRKYQLVVSQVITFVRRR